MINAQRAFKKTIAALEVEAGECETKAVEIRAVISRLAVYAGIAATSEVEDRPRKRRRRRRGRPRKLLEAKRTAPSSRRRRSNRSDNVTSAPSASPPAPAPLAAKARSVRGAAAFATELQAIEAVMQKVAIAREAITAAKTAKDKDAAAKASGELEPLELIDPYFQGEVQPLQVLQDCGIQRRHVIAG